jgi:hypothetical protein
VEENCMIWLKNFLMDQVNPDGAGAGGSGSPAGADGAGAAGGEGALPAGGAAGAAGQGAGNGGTPSAWAPLELTHNGQKVSVATQEEAIALLQKGYDYTQKAQEVAKLRKELLAKHSRADHFLTELEKSRQGKPDGEGDGEQPEQPDKLTLIEKEVAALRDKDYSREWERIYNPINQKYPDVPELELANAFKKALEDGEVENTAAAVEAVAAQLNERITGNINQRLEKQLGVADSPLVKAHNEKVISAFMSDAENPRLKEYAQKVIADYVAGKIKLRDAGGDAGGPGAGGGAPSDKKLTIAQVAARYSGAD